MSLKRFGRMQSAAVKARNQLAAAERVWHCQLGGCTARVSAATIDDSVRDGRGPFASNPSETLTRTIAFCALHL